MPEAPPWMKFSVNSWVHSDSRALMTLAQQGLYFNLLVGQWQRDGSLPDNPELLWRIGGCKSLEEFEAIKEPVMAKFDLDGNGRLFNPRCLEEFQAVRSSLEAKAEAGRKGGIAKAKAQHSSSTATASPEHTSGSKSKSREEEEEEKEKTLLSKLKTSFDAAPSSEEPKPTPNTLLREVFKHFLKLTGRSENMYELTCNRRLQGLKRIEELMRKTDNDIDRVREIMRHAIDRLAASDFHMGRDPKTRGKKFCEWEHVFRKWETFEGWVNGSKG